MRMIGPVAMVSMALCVASPAHAEMPNHIHATYLQMKSAMVDNARLVSEDFSIAQDTSPSGNLRFEVVPPVGVSILAINLCIENDGNFCNIHAFAMHHGGEVTIKTALRFRQACELIVRAVMPLIAPKQLTSLVSAMVSMRDTKKEKRVRVDGPDGKLEFYGKITVLGSIPGEEKNAAYECGVDADVT